MAAKRRKIAGSVRIVTLVAIAIVLAVGFVVLDRYNSGSKEQLAVETRGLQMISALSRYKLESGNFPDSLVRLVPKQAREISKCPNGTSIEYEAADGEYLLTCRDVGFRKQPYRYDSRTRSWSWSN
jgi:hypothetical protein